VQHRRPHDPPNPLDLDTPTGVAAIGALAVATSHWAGAILATQIATDAPPPGFRSSLVALAGLPAHLGAPALAWPASARASIPDAHVYWAAQAIVVVALAVLGLVVYSLGARRKPELSDQPQARFGTIRAIRPILTRRPAPGRFLLARRGRWLIAPAVDRPHAKARRSRASGGGGAIALVGPSRSGKTSTAITAIHAWQGPAILASVKHDLLDATVETRRAEGSILVYDPALDLPTERASWSPLEHATTLSGAQRSARALADAGPHAAGVATDFWLAQAEILLSGLLYIARAAHRSMSEVCDWILLQDHPDTSGPGIVQAHIERVLTSAGDPEASAAHRAAAMVHAVWALEARTRSSIYATAQTLIWPWCDTGIATLADASTDRQPSLDWLQAGNNTLYLCAPIEDQRRLSAAFGGLLNDLIGQTYRHCAATGRRLDPPLLIVIDEAGNTPLRMLPEYASTLAGFGVQLVTIWQSLGQIQSEYGHRADTILNNHTTKCFFAGSSDPSTLQYLEQALGRVRSPAVQRTRPSPDSGALQPLVPGHAARQMRSDRCLVVSGTLPPTIGSLLRGAH
jgi:type IV secretion system protein VirD4